MTASSRTFTWFDSGAPESRAAASLTLVGVLICGTLAFAARAPIAPSAPAAAVGAGTRLAEASPPRVVKRVDATATDIPCAHRAWPYYDARCPSPAAQTASAAAAAAPPAAPAPANPMASTPAAPAPAAPNAAAQASAALPEPSTTGAAARVDNPPPAYPPGARGADGYQRNWVTWDERDARDDRDPRYDEPVKPPKRQGGRRHQYGIFGFRF